jgi:LL-diaminopimelate aminotransferase
MFDFKLSKRLQTLPPYLFAQIDKEKRALRAQGKKLIDIGIGDPDILAPTSVSKELYKYSLIKEYQKYPLDAGLPSFKQEITAWSKKRFDITIDPENEILPLLGSKEGLVHFPLVFINPGDTILVPSPGYPGYKGACAFSGAKLYEMPLLSSNSFLPDLKKIPVGVRNKAKLIYVNYPNNPTSVLAPKIFLEELVRFCLKYGIILAYDNAYSEVYFDTSTLSEVERVDKKPLSILEIKGAKEIAVEFHSLSKTLCMTGFRIGWACGNAQLIGGLAKVKSNLDSGVFLALQKACEAALKNDNGYTDKMRKTIQERRDVFVKVLRSAGFKDIYAQATFYIWARIPKAWDSSIEYAKYLLHQKQIVATPGVGFGKYGEGYVRFAMTLDKKILKSVNL